MKLTEARPTGWYLDRFGRRWFCVHAEDGMRCTSDSGFYTAAFHKTFRAWGWKLEDRRALEQSQSQEGK